MSPSTKKRVAMSIMSSPLQKMSIGAKQYAMAVALLEAQKQVEVQALGSMGDDSMGDGDEEKFPVRRIHWGTVETRLVSYNTPFEVPDETTLDSEKKKKITTERMMKVNQIREVCKNVKNNLREYFNEKQAAESASTA